MTASLFEGLAAICIITLYGTFEYRLFTHEDFEEISLRGGCKVINLDPGLTYPAPRIAVPVEDRLPPVPCARAI